jgi:hypothetical protein
LRETKNKKAQQEKQEAYEQFLEANHKRAEQEAQSKKQAKIAYYKKQLEIQETKKKLYQAEQKLSE